MMSSQRPTSPFVLFLLGAGHLACSSGAEGDTPEPSADDGRSPEGDELIAGEDGEASGGSGAGGTSATPVTGTPATGGTEPGRGGSNSVPGLEPLPLSGGCVNPPEFDGRTVHEYDGSSSSTLNDILAAAQDGDVLRLTSSTDNSIKIDAVDFDPSNPLWIVADEGVTLSALTIQYSSGVNLIGARFRSDGGTLVKVVASQDIKILRNSFDLSGVEGLGSGQSALVVSPGWDTDENSERVEVGCNNFENIEFDGAESGSFIKTGFRDAEPSEGLLLDLIPAELHIHHNLFRNIAPVESGSAFAGDSDREAIAFGVSDSQDIETNHLVEFNLFEDCDGENEIITIKTSRNTVRHNTFKNSLGSVSIRFGSNTDVYGNYFFADSSNQHPFEHDTGGVRVYGSNHRIFNNYFEGLTGNSWRMPVLVDGGDTNDSSGGSGHERASNVQVVNNTFVACEHGVALGTNYDTAPVDTVISNNLFYNLANPMFSITMQNSTSFLGNMGFGSDPGHAFSQDELVLDDPGLMDDGQVYRLTAESAARDAGVVGAAYVTEDIEGHARTLPDVGADEYSTDEALLRPLSDEDVGPDNAPVVAE